jgi:predicted anti-sigma-YlaC factor YlaD
MNKTPRWIPILLWLLAALYLANGIEMFFVPSIWFFRIVPGVPETGPFNAHLVADSGTFYLGIAAGLVLAALHPRRHAVAVLVAAVASVMHAILHIYSHAAGLLSYQHLTTEIVGIYLPTIVLCVLALMLLRPAQESARAVLHAA